MSNTVEEINRNHFESNRRLNILLKHLGDKFYKTGEIHNAISDAMQEYASQFSTPQVVSEEDIERMAGEILDKYDPNAEYPSYYHEGDIIQAMVEMYKVALLKKQNDVTSDNATSKNCCDAPFKDNKLIQQLMEAAYCTGCGHRANEPLGVNEIGEKYLACCHDSNYVVSLSLAKSLLNSNQQ